MLRAAFLATARVVAAALHDPDLAVRWSDASALDGYTVGGLAGHLARSVLTVEAYLHGDEPLGEPISPAEYVIRAVGDADPVDSDVHRQVRARSAAAAEAGPEALAATVDEAIERLARRLSGEPPGRHLAVLDGMAMRLDDYLVTRMVEAVVHLDDLAVSLGAEPPRVPGEVEDVVVATLVEIAMARHGTIAMIRSLARRERVDEDVVAF